MVADRANWMQIVNTSGDDTKLSVCEERKARKRGSVHEDGRRAFEGRAEGVRSLAEEDAGGRRKGSVRSNIRET